MKSRLILKNILLITLLLSLNGCLSGDSKKTDTNKDTQTEQNQQKDKDKPKLPKDDTNTSNKKDNQTKPIDTNETKDNQKSKDDNSSTNDTKANKDDNSVSTEEGNSKNTDTTKETNTTNENNNTSTENTDNNETNTSNPTNKETLTLLPPQTQPLKNENLTLHVKNKNSNFIDKNIIWIVKPQGSIKENGTNVITPIKDTDITLQAKYNDTLSNKITLHVKWIVNGHELPPEPNPKINNSTLLGIDVNNNGVRDDVERWIYEEYKDKHPINIDILMQAARGYRKVLVMPEKALEIHNEVVSALDCGVYYSTYAKYFKEPIIAEKYLINNYFKKNIYFNTKERYRVYYEEYDRRLSGNVFSMPKIDKLKLKCDFNASKYY